jgi:hypothetical protein
MGGVEAEAAATEAWNGFIAQRRAQHTQCTPGLTALCELSACSCHLPQCNGRTLCVVWMVAGLSGEPCAHPNDQRGLLLPYGGELILIMQK